MIQIKLTRGQFALVDDEDYALVSRVKWCANRCRAHASYYAHHTTPDKKAILMHRLIMQAPEGVHVDHINGNGLDNRRCNLRLATRAQNKRNAFKMKRRTSSIYKGVFWYRRDNVWRASIKVDGKRHFLGRFNTELEAALAYNEAAVRLDPVFCRLNEVPKCSPLI